MTIFHCYVSSPEGTPKKNVKLFGHRRDGLARNLLQQSPLASTTSEGAPVFSVAQKDQSRNWFKQVKNMGLSENVGYISNEIAIFHRDNDQQNHWVFRGTLFSDKPKSDHHLFGKNTKNEQLLYFV